MTTDNMEEKKRLMNELVKVQRQKKLLLAETRESELLDRLAALNDEEVDGSAPPGIEQTSNIEVDSPDVSLPSRNSSTVNGNPTGNVNGSNFRGTRGLSSGTEDTVNQGGAGVKSDTVPHGVVPVDLTSDDESEVGEAFENDTRGGEIAVADTIDVKVKVEPKESLFCSEANDRDDVSKPRYSPTPSFGYGESLTTDPSFDVAIRPEDLETAQNGQGTTTLHQDFGARAEITSTKRSHAENSIDGNRRLTMLEIEAGQIAGAQRSQFKRPKLSGDQISRDRQSIYDQLPVNKGQPSTDKKMQSLSIIETNQPKISNTKTWTPMNKRQRLTILGIYATSFDSLARKHIRDCQNLSPT